jgi:hypothetical protein
MTDEQLLLEQRKVKALEKIATTLDALTVWFEEIEKDEWSDRIQWYMAEWHKTIQKPIEKPIEEPKPVHTEQLVEPSEELEIISEEIEETTEEVDYNE